MRSFILFISLFLSLSLFSQSENGERVLSAKCAIQQTMGGVGYWQVSITNFSDPGGQVDATAIDTFDYVQFSDSGTPYALQVVGVVSAVGNTATVKLSNVGITGISSVPTTSNATWSRRTENFGLTPWPANITGNDAQLNQEYTVYKIDSILGTFSVGSDIDYITTDSFSTFIGGHTFASIPVNKTIFRTTTGSLYRKSSTTNVIEVTVGNGLLATTKLTQSGATLTWNSNLNNRVGLNTGANASVTITNPTNLTSQTFGETFAIQVSTGTIPVTVTFDTIYSKFDFTAFGGVNLAAFTEATYSFRVVKSGNKSFKLSCTDDLGGGVAQSGYELRDTVTQTAHGFSRFTPIHKNTGTGWQKADSNAGVNSDSLLADAIVIDSLSANSFVYQAVGNFTHTSHGKTVAQQYYLQPTVGTSGVYETAGCVKQFLFIPLDANTVFINVHQMPFDSCSSGGGGTGVTVGIKGDINVVGADSDWQIVAGAVGSNEIATGGVANVDLAAGTGGIFKGDGTTPSDVDVALADSLNMAGRLWKINFLLNRIGIWRDPQATFDVAGNETDPLVKFRITASDTVFSIDKNGKVVFRSPGTFGTNRGFEILNASNIGVKSTIETDGKWVFYNGSYNPKTMFLDGVLGGIGLGGGNGANYSNFASYIGNGTNYASGAEPYARIQYGALSPTTGTFNTLRVSANTTPTSGNATINALQVGLQGGGYNIATGITTAISHSLNQNSYLTGTHRFLSDIVTIGTGGTGAASSTEYSTMYSAPTFNFAVASTASLFGLRINPTFTALNGSSYKAISIENNNSATFGIHQSGANTPNYFAGKVQMAGGIQKRTRTVASNYTVVSGDYAILVDATSGNVTVTLPDAATVYDGTALTGQEYRVQRIDGSGNTVTVIGDGSDTFNGATSFLIASQYEAYEIQVASTTTFSKR